MVHSDALSSPFLDGALHGQRSNARIRGRGVYQDPQGRTICTGLFLPRDVTVK